MLSSTTFKTILNKGLILSDFKRFGWVSALYTLLLLLILPFNHMMKISHIEDDWAKNHLLGTLDIFSYYSELQTILICTVPIILAVLIFRYLNNSKSTAMLHSLPLNRQTLYCSHSTAGLLMLFLPVLLVGIILMLLNITTSLNECYSIYNIFQWIGATLLFDTLLYFITVFVGMFTGNSIAHLAFTYILHVLPVGLYSLWGYNIQKLLYGYPNITSFDNLLNNLPLFLLLDRRVGMGYLTLGTIFVYLLVIALFSVAAAYFYKIRKLEVAGDVIAFPAVRPIFKYGVTACAMLLSGAYFSSAYEYSLPILIFGYILGSLLGYLVSEILLQKSYKVWSKYKGYLGYVAVVGLLLLGIVTDVTGYVNRVPDIDQIENVYFSTNIYEWNRLEEENPSTDKPHVVTESNTNRHYSNNYFFTDTNNIKNITLLHKSLLEKPYNEQGNWNYIIYKLKNGNIIIRFYRIDQERYASSLKPIYESLEYKKARFPLLTQDLTNIKLIEINDERTVKNPFVMANKKDIQGFTDLLKQEINATKFEELNDYHDDNVFITIKYFDKEEKTIRYSLRNSYQIVIQWLKVKGYYDEIMLLPEEISYVTIENVTDENSNPNKETEQLPAKPIKIVDKKVIDELINLSVSYNYDWKDTSQYHIRFFENDNNNTKTPQSNTGIVNTSRQTWHFRLSGNTPVSETLKSYLEQG